MKTLLIDCDLRKPTIHRLYDVPATPGFSEFLRGEVGVDEVVRATTADGPDLITAGACDARALRAWSQATAARSSTSSTAPMTSSSWTARRSCP